MPLDIYVEVPDNVGGFVRLHEIPEIVRVAAPVYLKFGLRNAPDVYPAGTHLEATTVALTRERVRARAPRPRAAGARVGRLRDLRAGRSRARARARRRVSADVVTLGEALVALVADEGRRARRPAGRSRRSWPAPRPTSRWAWRASTARSPFVGPRRRRRLGQMVRTGLRGEGVDVRWLTRRPRRADRRAGARPAPFPHPEVVYLRRGSAASRLDADDVAAAGESIAGRAGCT